MTAKKPSFAADDAPHVANYGLVGYVDQAEPNLVRGWAFNTAAPGRKVDVEFLVDGETVASMTADGDRPDVEAAGFGAGSARSGFALRNIGSIASRSEFSVTVRFRDGGRHLTGSPFTLRNSRLGLDDPAKVYLDSLFASLNGHARRAGDLDEPVHLLLGLLDRTLARRTELEAQDGDEPNAVESLLAGETLTDRFRHTCTSLLKGFPQLALPRPILDADPLVSIVIPVYNHFATTYECLRAIAEAPQRSVFEIILVDDGSCDETMLCALVLGDHVRILRNPANLGFIASCNRGAEAARGRFVLFLNNDVLVGGNWLDELADTLARDDAVGVAGSMLLNPDGTLQEAGGIVWRFGDAWNFGRGEDPDLPRYAYMREADYVSGAALMVRSELFRSLGGFDFAFAPAYYEDTDLCFRVRKAGFKVVVQPLSRVVHLEGVTSGTDVAGTGVKRYQTINQTRFFDRWRTTLEAHRLNGEQPLLEAQRHVQHTALFIDESVPTPDQDAGSNAAFQHMLSLQRLGYKVTFIPSDNLARVQPYTADLQRVGIECLHSPYFQSVEEIFRKIERMPDLVYFHRVPTANRYLRLARTYFKSAAIVYNVSDLHHIRMERQNVVEGRAALSTEAMRLRQMELACVDEADITITHSSTEVAMLRAERPDAVVSLVRWAVHASPTPVDFQDRSGVVFIGGYSHPPNVDAARYLVTEVMPIVWKTSRNVTISLLGSNMPPDVRKLAGPGVAAVGYVPRLSPYMHGARVCVAPLRYGAGLKGKVLESMAHGVPCVMSEIAAEGLDLDDDLAWLVCHSTEEVAAKVLELHRSKRLNLKLSSLCLRHVVREFSNDALDRSLGSALAGPAGRRRRIVAGPAAPS